MTSGLLIPDHLMLLLPVLIIGLGALIMLMMSAFIRPSIRMSALFTVVVLFAAGAVQVGPIRAAYSFTSAESILSGMVVGDTFGAAVGLVIIAAGLASCFFAWSYFDDSPAYRPEFFALILFCLFGMQLAVMSVELMSIVICLEIASASLYALVGIDRRGAGGAEALFKFLVLGTFSMAFAVMGVALIYGQTGSTMISDIRYATSGLDVAQLPLMAVGVVFLLVALLFKLAAFPMHAWAPDVFEGAPVAVAGFLAAALPVAAGAILVRLSFDVLLPVREAWFVPVSVAAVASMVVGNFLAIGTDNVKRIFAGASVVHGGCVLAGVVGITGPGSAAASSVLVYLAAYAAAIIGVFSVLVCVSDSRDRVAMSNLAGLASTRPGAAAVMALFIFSFIGVPPTVGFLGKYALITSIFDAGHPVLALSIIASTALSLVYYLRIIGTMYFDASAEETGGWFTMPARLVMFFTGLGVAWSGFGTATLIAIPGAPAIVHIARFSIISLTNVGF